MSVRLGVDLGTTWTAAAVQRGAHVEALTLGTQTAAMPSVLAVDGEQVVAGEQAGRRLLAEPASGVRESKRRLGDTTPIVMGGKPYGAEALLGHLLRHVVNVVTEREGSGPAEVVLTHPATWGEYKLDLLRETGRLAGVGDVALVGEPVAAAMQYVALGRIRAGDIVAVYDWGGGTFDAAVVRCTQSGAEILGVPEGLERVGGVDLDQIILSHVDAALAGGLRDLDTTDAEVRRGVIRLRTECTAAKEALSTDTEATVSITVPGLNTQVRITREEFEAAARSRIGDTLGALDRAVASAGITPDDLAGVLLVGGSSRIPVVAEEVGRHTGRPALLDADPKLVVALGAAGGNTVMAAPKKTGKEDNDVESVGSATTPAAPNTPAGKAAATAAALRGPAAKQGAGKGDKGSVSGPGVAAGLGVAAAGVAAAGYAATQILGDDDTEETEEPVAAETPVEEESLDAFDDAGGGGGGGGRAFGGGNGGGGGRRAVDDSAEPVVAEAAAADAAGDPLESIRAELRERLANWEPPEGADPAEAEALRAELEGLIDRYQVTPGQSTDHALADLRQQFDDQVEDFVQDVKIDRIIEEQQQDVEAPPDRPGYDWVPEQDGVAGHWERERAGTSTDEDTDEYDDPGPRVNVRDHRGDDDDGAGGVTVTSRPRYRDDRDDDDNPLRRLFDNADDGRPVLRDHRGEAAAASAQPASVRDHRGADEAAAVAQPTHLGDTHAGPTDPVEMQLPDAFDEAMEPAAVPQPAAAASDPSSVIGAPAAAEASPTATATATAPSPADDLLGVESFQTATANADLGVATAPVEVPVATDVAPADIGAAPVDVPVTDYIADPALGVDPALAAVAVDIDQPDDYVADESDFEAPEAEAMDEAPSLLDDNDPNN